MSETMTTNNTNSTRLTQIRQLWHELLEHGLRRGFHGTIAVEASIQDGVIQHCKSRKEQLAK